MRENLRPVPLIIVFSYSHSIKKELYEETAKIIKQESSFLSSKEVDNSLLK